MSDDSNDTAADFPYEYVGPKKRKVQLTPQVRALRERAKMGLGPATSSLTASRVAIIADHMRKDTWNNQERLKYRRDWMLSRSRIDQLTAEASRWTAQECTNVRDVTQTIAETLQQKLTQARELSNISVARAKLVADGDKAATIRVPIMKDAALMFGSVERIADTWSKVIGARAPEKHEHSVESFDNLPIDDKIRWVDDRIEKLQHAREKLLEIQAKDTPALTQTSQIIEVKAEPTNGTSNGVFHADEHSDDEDSGSSGK